MKFLDSMNDIMHCRQDDYLNFVIVSAAVFREQLNTGSGAAGNAAGIFRENVRVAIFDIAALNASAEVDYSEH